jgi:hypothetical protein
MHGELLQRGAAELTRAATADPRKQLEGALAIALFVAAEPKLDLLGRRETGFSSG